MNYLLDTCVLSELTRPKPDAQVARWLRDTPDTAKFISVISLGEIGFGVRLARDMARRRKLEDWYADTLRPAFDNRVLPFDEPAAERWAVLRADDRNTPVLDAQIGATALAHGLTLVTRNVKDFGFAGLKLFNPWGKA